MYHLHSVSEALWFTKLINQEIIDLKILYVEIESFVYYNTTQVSSVDTLKTNINPLFEYSLTTHQ